MKKKQLFVAIAAFLCSVNVHGMNGEDFFYVDFDALIEAVSSAEKTQNNKESFGFMEIEQNEEARSPRAVTTMLSQSEIKSLVSASEQAVFGKENLLEPEAYIATPLSRRRKSCDFGEDYMVGQKRPYEYYLAGYKVGSKTNKQSRNK